MPGEFSTEDVHSKPVGEVVDQIVEESHRALESGARATAEIEELKRRADEALDLRKQLDRHKWIPIGAAMGVAVLLFLVFRKR